MNLYLVMGRLMCLMSVVRKELFACGYRICGVLWMRDPGLEVVFDSG